MADERLERGEREAARDPGVERRRAGLRIDAATVGPAARARQQGARGSLARPRSQRLARSHSADARPLAHRLAEQGCAADPSGGASASHALAEDRREGWGRAVPREISARPSRDRRAGLRALPHAREPPSAPRCARGATTETSSSASTCDARPATRVDLAATRRPRHHTACSRFLVRALPRSARSSPTIERTARVAAPRRSWSIVRSEFQSLSGS